MNRNLNPEQQNQTVPFTINIQYAICAMLFIYTEQTEYIIIILTKNDVIDVDITDQYQARAGWETVVIMVQLSSILNWTLSLCPAYTDCNA